MARPRPGTFDPPGTGRWPPLFPSNLEQRQLRTQHQRVKVSGHHEPPRVALASRMIGGAMPEVDQLEMKARIGEILNRWPAVGLAVGASATDASSSSTDTRLPTSFRIAPPWFEIGTDRVIFSREPGVGTTAPHLDFAPLSFQKQTARTNPRLWAPARSARRRWPPLHRPFGGEADNN